MKAWPGRPVRVAVATTLAVPLLLATPISVAAQSDPLKDAPTGTLKVTVDVQGQRRHDARNKVEWHELTVSRRMELELPMVRVETAPVGFDTSPKAEAAQEEQAGGQPSAGYVEMQKAIAACNGDQQCLMQASVLFGRVMEEGGMDKPAPSPAAEAERFDHWAVDRRKTCATGVIAIDDEGQGVAISRSERATPFSYRRGGEIRLPAELEPVADEVCSAMLAIDTVEGTLDIAVPGFTVPVELTYSGVFAGETGRSVLFVEGTKEGVQPGTVDLYDFPIDPTASEMSGEREIEQIGQVLYPGEYGTMPVRATVAWSFVRN